VSEPWTGIGLSAEEAGAEIARLRRINDVLVARVERSLDRQGNAFSLFQTATGLEARVQRRTSELTRTLADLERSNTDLAGARDSAEDASRSKTRFLAAASHDVLQPLNAALLSMSSLATLQTDREGQRLCAQVERSLETMDALLRTLLYMSRLDGGDIVPRITGVSLDRLFDSLASDFEPVARLRGLELRVRHSGLHVRSDETLLRRVLQNILANALRYTDRGGVLLIAGGRGEHVYVRVADTGIGIARERQSEVFAEFSRGQQPSTPDQDAAAGLGLGLAIVERLVTTLGHRIALQSRLGHGSCFRLTLPVAEPPPLLPPSGGEENGAGSARLRGARILVIENDLAALAAMEGLLRQWGCDLRLSASTGEAVDSLVSGDWVPELVLADQHLDGEDRGTTAIVLLRRLVSGELPALLVTAAPSPGLHRSCEAARIEIMEKPLKPAQLRALLSHLLAVRARLPA